MSTQFFYGQEKLTVQLAIALAQKKVSGAFSRATIDRIRQSSQYVSTMVRNDKTVYGITTGFGILANTKISEDETATLQYKILQSHSVGVGSPVPPKLSG
jgi:histidine ammonia-lyase